MHAGALCLVPRDQGGPIFSIDSAGGESPKSIVRA